MEKREPEVHPKSWGYELWVDNGPEYCGKLLVFTRRNSGTTMHFHLKKLETMFVVRGEFLVDYIDTSDGAEHSLVFRQGETLRIPRGMPHRITAIEQCSHLMEVSTTHEESDSYRVGPRLG